MKIAWCTDLHLDWVDESGWRKLIREIHETKTKSLVVGFSHMADKFTPCRRMWTLSCLPV